MSLEPSLLQAALPQFSQSVFVEELLQPSDYLCGLLWTCSNSSMSFMCWGPHMLYSRWKYNVHLAVLLDLAVTSDLSKFLYCNLVGEFLILSPDFSCNEAGCCQDRCWVSPIGWRHYKGYMIHLQPAFPVKQAPGRVVQVRDDSHRNQGIISQFPIPLNMFQLMAPWVVILKTSRRPSSN